MLYRQPQNGPFEIDRAGNGARLFFAAIPALSLRNLSTGRAFTIVSPATGNQVSNGPNGLDLMIHPAGGSNGYGGLRASDPAGSSDDWTLIWIGRPQNYSAGNGKLMARGADSAGNGWNIQFGYSGGPTSGSGTGSLVATVVDTSPAAFSVTLSGISLAVDQHERVAMVKRGSTIKVFNWRTRQMASASAGNGALRTSTLGIALGLDTNNDVTTAGHNKVNTALAYDFGMPDSEVWATLDNPWEDFESDGTILRTTGGATDTPVNPAVGALALTGYAPTVARTANQALTPAAGALALTGYAPTVAQSSSLALIPGAGSLAITGYAPSVVVGLNQAVAPGVGSLSITGYAPTVTQAITTAIAPGVGSLTLTGYSPSIAQSVNQSVTPDVGVLTLTGYAPTLAQSANQALSPATGAMVITGYAPVVTQVSASPSLVPGAGSITITGYEPTVTQSGGAGRPNKTFQVETSRGVIEVATLDEVAEIVRTEKRRPKAAPVEVKLEGMKVSTPSLKPNVDYKAIEERTRAQVQAEMDDEEELLMMLL